MQWDATSSVVRVPALLLAAGLSSRMGSFKPVLELGGEKLVVRVIRSLLESGRVSEVIVVTGHQREKVEEAVGSMERVSCVFNPDFAAGEMVSSVRVGLGTIQRKGVGAVVLSFADQPAVASQTVTRIIGMMSPDAPLVIPTFGGKRGHPLLLSRELFGEILQLRPDETLRTVVHRHLQRAALIEVNDASILEDLDTPGDFERMRRRYGN